MIKKYNMYMKENLDDLDYEEEEDEPEMVMIGLPGYDSYEKGSRYHNDGYIYILDKIIDKNNAILYNNFKHTVHNITNDEYYHILTNEELKKHIYSNNAKIAVYKENHIGLIGSGEWLKYYWKDLPKEIKDLL